MLAQRRAEDGVHQALAMDDAPDTAPPLQPVDVARRSHGREAFLAIARVAPRVSQDVALGVGDIAGDVASRAADHVRRPVELVNQRE